VIVDPGMLPPPGGRTSLLKALEQVTDPRAPRGIRHSIASTLAMVVAAGLSGAGRSFRSVGDFAADLPQDALARLGAPFTRYSAATSCRTRRRSAATCR
jgi:DDE_Tnp_1-associated